MALSSKVYRSASEIVRLRAAEALSTSRAAAIAALGAASALTIAAAAAAFGPQFGAWGLLSGSLIASSVAAIAGIWASAGRRRDYHTRAGSAAQAAAHDDIVDALEDLIELRDANGRLTFANRAWRSTCTSDAGNLSSDVEMIGGSDGPRWISWRTQRIASANGADETLRVGRDITIARRTSMELIEARECAEAASFAKSRFLASMSHEIRTPMNGILGIIWLLSETELTQAQRGYADTVAQSAQALLHLVDEILDVSRIESGRLVLASDPFSLAACIARAGELLAPRAADKGLTLTWSIDESVPEFVIGDEARLRQILLNLLSNAVKFTDVGSVTVRAYLVRGAPDEESLPLVVVDVTDTGVGFEPDILDRLFDEFDQGDAVLHRGRGGAGLGLSISRSLARAMGGDITAEGSVGEGATFKVGLRLPAVSRAAEPVGEIAITECAKTMMSPSTPPSKPATGHTAKTGILDGRRVLIADDNAINALLLRRVVERMGGAAIIATDGSAAVAAMKQCLSGAAPPIDLILMDMFMPVMCGLQATRAIAALFAESPNAGISAPPIIALTAGAYAEDRTRCLAAGMSDYLAKPFDIDELQSLVETWLPRD